jgi:DNA alkylation repair enzyme
MGEAICRAHHAAWSIDAAPDFAEALMTSRVLDVKAVAIALMAGYRKAFKPTLLPVCKRWLSEGYSSNWATTDSAAARSSVRCFSTSRLWSRGWTLGQSPLHVDPSRLSRQPHSNFAARSGTGSGVCRRRPAASDESGSHSESRRLDAERSRQGRSGAARRVLEHEKIGYSADDRALRDRAFSRSAAARADAHHQIADRRQTPESAASPGFNSSVFESGL